MTGLDRSALAGLNADASADLIAARDEAFELFEKMEMPSPAEEAWRYIELPRDIADFDLPERSGAVLAESAFLDLDHSARAIIVDGRPRDLSGGCLQVLPQAAPVVPPQVDKPAAAHAAFAGDGLRVSVPRGALTTAPVVIDVQSTQAETVSFPRVQIELGEDAEAEILVVYRSPEDVSSMLIPEVGIDLKQGARLRMLSVQALGLATTCLTYQRARVGRDATARIGEVGLGGRLGRLDLGVDLEGAGGSVEVAGLYFGHRRQTLDYRLVINHRGPHTRSEVFLKGAVEDEAESVFTGLLRIEKPALRSWAYETNRNLVLSEGAKAHSVPNLEILCNDVMCGHGSSVGPLDEDHLYYLMSRGLKRPRAERLLIRGFFREALERLPVTGLEASVGEVLDERFVRAQAEGRI